MRKTNSKHPGFPKQIKAGGVVVKVYRVHHPSTKGGFAYSVRAGATGLGQYGTLTKAMAEGRLKAAQIQSGQVEAAELTRGDRDELVEARNVCGDTPLLSAVKEWARARKLTDGHVIAASEAWAARSTTEKFDRILVGEAVNQFISQKQKKKKEGERTYRSKLTPLATFFKDRYLDSLTVAEYEAYLEQWDDAVTQNDFRKRAVTLCRWARKKGFLPKRLALAIEDTERASETPTDIGILTPEVYGELLRFFKRHHPEHLAALVLAGFTGIRSDEIHGKRSDRSRRQIWEHVFLDREHPHVQVTIAKKNTPSSRPVPLDIFSASDKADAGSAAAIEWLRSCPSPHVGELCEAGAMEKVRKLAISAGFTLPTNCFRHSFITYAVALAGNKAQTATWAGNSVKEIDRRYRRGDITPDIAVRWFSMTPEKAEALPITITANSESRTET